MPMINITVRNKIASADKSVYVCGNSDYVLKFDFDSEWNAFTSKTARIHHGATYTDVVFNGNECALPVLRDVYNFKVGVYAGNLHTTTPAVVFAKKSILCEGGLPADPASPSVYTQIMEAVGGKANSSHTHSYDDLTDKPDIPEAYDDTEVKGMIAGKADAVHTHSYNNLTDKPTIPTVDSNSIKAALGVDVVQAIDNAERQIDDLDEGKADADHVHSYNDLTNKPVIPSAYDDTEIRQDIAGKADAAHTHSYNALTDKPVIPAAYDDTAVRGLIDGLDSGKADADHVHSYDEIVDRPDAYDDAEIRASIAENKRKLDSLWALNKGISYSFETDEDEAYIKTVPSGAKSATLLEIGGKTVLQDGELISADVTGIRSVGANYFSFCGLSDIVDITTPSGIRKGWAFVAPFDGVMWRDSLYKDDGSTTIFVNVFEVDGSNVASSGSVGQLHSSSDTSTNRSPVRITAGQRYAIAINRNVASVAVDYFSKINIMIERGSAKTSYKPYSLTTYEIPESVRTAYPLRSAGSVHDSYALDGSHWWHVQRVGADAVDMAFPVLDTPVYTDITEQMNWEGRIAVEEGGSLTFVQSTTEMDVPSTVEYIVQADPSVDVQINGTSITQNGVANLTLDALGAERAKGEWVLKGTLFGTADDRGNIDTGVNVDLSGCTEVALIGLTTGTGNTFIKNNLSYFAGYCVRSGNRSICIKAEDSDVPNGYYFPFGRYQDDRGIDSFSMAMNYLYSCNSGKKIRHITSFGFINTSLVTSCDIKIYAR